MCSKVCQSNCCCKVKKCGLFFYFNKNDPEFMTTTNVVSNEPNYISHSFVRCPIYDIYDRKIGYKVSDDYVQQVGQDKYIVRLNNSYYFKNRGTISWQYIFNNNKPEIYYPVGVPAVSNIISGTGDFLHKHGTVSLLPDANGKRFVEITFFN
jgi:hypothetical protein